jgi:hypothetical protein
VGVPEMFPVMTSIESPGGKLGVMLQLVTVPPVTVGEIDCVATPSVKAYGEFEYVIVGGEALDDPPPPQALNSVINDSAMNLIVLLATLVSMYISGAFATQAKLSGCPHSFSS